MSGSAGPSSGAAALVAVGMRDIPEGVISTVSVSAGTSMARAVVARDGASRTLRSTRSMPSTTSTSRSSKWVRSSMRFSLPARIDW